MSELQVIAEGDHTGEKARQCRVSAETINDVLLRHRAAVTRTLPVCLLLILPRRVRTGDDNVKHISLMIMTSLSLAL